MATSPLPDDWDTEDGRIDWPPGVVGEPFQRLDEQSIAPHQMVGPDRFPGALGGAITRHQSGLNRMTLGEIVAGNVDPQLPEVVGKEQG